MEILDTGGEGGEDTCGGSGKPLGSRGVGLSIGEGCLGFNTSTVKSETAEAGKSELCEEGSACNAAGKASLLAPIQCFTLLNGADT